MSADHDAVARDYLETLCAVRPNRRTGSSGNRAATEFFANTVSVHGLEVDAAPFACLDHVCEGATLAHERQRFAVHASPYSLGCRVSAELVVVSTVEELEESDCRGKVLLMQGEICAEQLMPKNFVFYNPEHHKRIVSLLEDRAPAAIVTATRRNPEQVGALYPFPLITDGDFDIPSVYCTETVGHALVSLQGRPLNLRIEAEREPSSATNVVACLNREAATKVVVTAHIDAFEGSPGASDNASGTTVLLLLTELLSDYRGDHCVEIVALNGEDHYSAAGQMDYLERYGNEFPRIVLAINIDDVGYRKGRSAYSFYGCSSGLEGKVRSSFGSLEGLVPGEQWFNGDHMVFVQDGVPSMAFTSERMPELMRTVTHTSSDTPDIVDCSKLVEVAQALNLLVRSL